MARTHFSNIHLLKRHSWALNTFILDLKRSWRLNYSHWGELISRKVTSFNSKFSYKIDAFLLSTFRKNNIKKFLDKWSINFLIIGSRYMSHMRSQAKKTNAFSFFSINHVFEGQRYPVLTDEHVNIIMNSNIILTWSFRHCTRTPYQMICLEEFRTTLGFASDIRKQFSCILFHN